MKKLIIFDLDGTLAKSKATVDKEMAELLELLLKVAKVAIISGGDWPQFEKQVLNHLSKNVALKKLSILPTCGTKYYEYDQEWTQLYAESFNVEERNKILDSLDRAIKASNLKINKTWGEQIEDRGSQITFSALGQQAPLDAKKVWDTNYDKRKKIVNLLAITLPEFSVHMGGATSIDITRPGIDKAYGIKKLRDILSIPISEMLYIGDALFEGGNDYPARASGAVCIQVRDSDETKRVVEALIACLATTD